VLAALFAGEFLQDFRCFLRCPRSFLRLVNTGPARNILHFPGE
jgi:hypothetical protein